jgi:hypothetical protein
VFFDIKEDEPLNSEDDDSDDGATDLFDTENVVVCQFDKVRHTLKAHGYYFMYADGLGLGFGLGLDTNSISGHNNRHT